MQRFSDRYGRDVLSASPHPKRPKSVETPAEPGLVVEDVETGFCGAVVECDKHGVTLEDRHGKRRAFPLGPGFWIDGKPVALVRPRTSAPAAPTRTASGSRPVQKLRARTARESRVYVEGKHDAELVEKIWGHDLRVEGVVVEELGGADDLEEIIREFEPGPGRRLGVLLDHMVDGSKEARIAERATAGVGTDHVLIIGHPYVDVWQAVRPSVLGIDRWPDVPRGVPWKEGVLTALGWKVQPYEAWRRILGSVSTYTDLEPAFLGRVEELIDFVTAPGTS
ncbi:DUF3097 domain-containing protein [Phytoactinopolyspora halotolerans]|uniref:DUF3097 domain-containing protein n=1 Tax=Phytoactinopolyspora halotolerans TaxID=1981512 RepID=A0A6L9S5V5_9ACTN|nr:DUF3097 domain-containing protein [Phytoactinopolyspora halotolerans]NED99887.1 DUF3097 domain-containing protein [Phytoactinopolyspora halotolerans]